VVCLFSNAQAQVPSYVPSNGLVGWWPFNGNANDESGNGNNGTLNGPTLTADRFGNANKAYSFDGVNDYINIPYSNSLNINGSISISCWFKNTNISSTNNGVLVFHGDNQSGKDPFTLNYNGNLNRVSFAKYVNSGTTPADLRQASIIAPNNSNWNHYIVTFDSTIGRVCFYLNNSLVLDTTFLNTSIFYSTNVSSFFTSFGGLGPLGQFSNSFLDDIGIWNRALTQQEINNLYNSSAYVPCASPAFPANLANGLVGYWPFCGDANDESGNGNNGTVNGATLTSDRFGNPNSAYYFDGVNASIATNANFSNSNNAKSISVWAKFSDLGNRGWLVSNNTCINGSNYDGFGFFQEGPSQNFYFYGMNNGDRLISNQLDTSLFYHFVAAFQQDTLKVYLNGLEVTASYNPLNTNSANGVLFGDRFSGVLSGPCGNDNLTGGLFNGILDDIGIWNRALNASEVQQLYNTGIYFQTVTGSCDTLQFNANITGFNPITYQNQVKVFPNPAKDNLVIDCGANFNTLTGYSMKILNTVGQSVYNSLITQQVTNIPLTAPTWSPGAYIVQFINTTGTVIEAKQIIIQ